MATPTKHTQSLSRESFSSNLTETPKSVSTSQASLGKHTESSQYAISEKHVIDDRGGAADSSAPSDENPDTEEGRLQNSTLLYPFDNTKQEKRPKPARYHTMCALPSAKTLRVHSEIS